MRAETAWNRSRDSRWHAFRIDDRTVALVTGAAQGIGLGIARSLAMASYRVVLADIEDELVARVGRRVAGRGV